MSWHGPYGKGAMRAHRNAKREDAVRRGADTPPERTKVHRLGPLTQHGYRTVKSIRRHLTAEPGE